MNPVVKVVITLIGLLAVLVAIGWLGLQVKPKPFPAYPEQTPALNTGATIVRRNS